MRTKEIHELQFPFGGNVFDQSRVENAYQAAMDAANGDSNDGEIDLLRELVDELLSYAAITVQTEEVTQCDECDDEADVTWPKLNPPVALCDSCHHNARRSGWEPGQ